MKLYQYETKNMEESEFRGGFHYQFRVVDFNNIMQHNPQAHFMNKKAKLLLTMNTN